MSHSRAQGNNKRRPIRIATLTDTSPLGSYGTWASAMRREQETKFFLDISKGNKRLKGGRKAAKRKQRNKRKEKEKKKKNTTKTIAISHVSCPGVNGIIRLYESDQPWTNPGARALRDSHPASIVSSHYRSLLLLFLELSRMTADSRCWTARASVWSTSALSNKKQTKNAT